VKAIGEKKKRVKEYLKILRRVGLILTNKEAEIVRIMLQGLSS
jgi:hypothetical protein